MDLMLILFNPFQVDTVLLSSLTLEFQRKNSLIYLTLKKKKSDAKILLQIKGRERSKYRFLYSTLSFRDVVYSFK